MNPELPRADVCGRCGYRWREPKLTRPVVVGFMARVMALVDLIASTFAEATADRAGRRPAVRGDYPVPPMEWPRVAFSPVGGDGLHLKCTCPGCGYFWRERTWGDQE